MKIIVDENIPYGREAFETLGEVETMAGRAITRAALAAADILVVRSITTVDRELLEGTPVRFVGTCTIGEDHIDRAYLAEQGIGFSSAPGCNANSVGEYVIAALLDLAERHDLDLTLLRLGIVGVGNVGARVLAKATALGMSAVLNDPPLADETGDPRYRPIDEILDCDIITLHVPLEHSGPYPTFHMVDAEFLRWLKPTAILLNTARGPVVDNFALKTALDKGNLRAAVLDVWEGEPNVDMGLLDAVDIATPHIAGYSFDGKVNGTRRIYEAACGFLGVPSQWDALCVLPEPEVGEITVNPLEANALGGAVRAVYDIMRDDTAMRGISRKPKAKHGAYFDRLRKNYPRRREFFNTRVRLSAPSPELESRLAGLGFDCGM